MSQQEVNFRRSVEKQIVTAVVEDAIKAGYFLDATVDGEDLLDDETQNAQEVIDILMDADEAHLFLHEKNNPDNYFGWVYFVFGNNMGETVVSDYTTNLKNTGILTRADAISEAIENGNFTIQVI